MKALSCWLVVITFFSSIIICRTQLILPDISNDADEALEGELEFSLTKAEDVLATLQSKITSREGKEITEEAKLAAINESVKEMDQENQKLRTQALPDDIKDAKSIINESVLQELEDELDNGDLFTEKDRDLEADKIKAQKMIGDERKKIHDERKERDSLSELKTKKNIRSGGKKRVEEQIQQQVVEFEKEAKLVDSSGIQDNQKHIIGMEDAINSGNKKGAVIEEKNEDIDAIFAAVGDVLESLSREHTKEFNTVLGKEPEKLEEKNDNDPIKATEQVASGNTTVQQINISKIIARGDELHEDLLEEQEEVEEMLAKTRQEEINKQIHLIPTDLKQNDSPSTQQQVDNSLSGETDYLFTRSIEFTLAIVLAFLIIIFGCQFDIVSFFTQRRRPKSFFIKQEDESRKSLLSS